MKTITTTLAICLTLFGTQAFADDDTTRRERRQKLRTRILAKFDADGNGKLDRSERRALHDARKARRLDRADKNDDGKLSRRERRFDRVDKNNDGEIGKREKRHAKRKTKRKVKRKHVKRKLDKDNNPPGKRGGPGTNWENPPGKRGGPGASPNVRPKTKAKRKVRRTVRRARRGGRR